MIAKESVIPSRIAMLIRPLIVLRLQDIDNPHKWKTLVCMGDHPHPCRPCSVKNFPLVSNVYYGIPQILAIVQRFVKPSDSNKARVSSPEVVEVDPNDWLAGHVVQEKGAAFLDESQRSCVIFGRQFQEHYMRRNLWISLALCFLKYLAEVISFTHLDEHLGMDCTGFEVHALCPIL
jgi:hypothetical protein